MKDSENLGIKTIRYNSTDSTQLRAKEVLKNQELCAPFCITAGTQTGGYGQAGRAYYCPYGGLYMSLVVPGKDFRYKFATGFVAVCVARAIERAIAQDPRSLAVKWVNDLLLDGKKVGGVLIEKVGGHFVIGVGLNLIQTEPVPEELGERIGFLNAAVSAADIVREIMTLKLTDAQVLTEYKKYCNIDGLNVDGSIDYVAPDGKSTKKFSNL